MAPDAEPLALAAPDTARKTGVRGGSWQIPEGIMALYAALHANQLVEGHVNERAQRANLFFADEIVKMPEWGAWWTGARVRVQTPQDSIRARIKALNPGPREAPDQSVLNRGWQCNGYMHKMCKAFEEIRAKGPDNISAGPYKARPIFPRDQLTYNEIPTGTTEEEYWKECEDEAFAFEKEFELDGAPPELKWCWRLACPDSPFYQKVDKLKIRLAMSNPAAEEGDVNGLHAFIPQRECKYWLIDPRVRAEWRGYGFSRAAHRGFMNLAASCGQDHWVPQNVPVPMNSRQQVAATERNEVLRHMRENADRSANPERGVADPAQAG